MKYHYVQKRGGRRLGIKPVVVCFSTELAPFRTTAASKPSGADIQIAHARLLFHPFRPALPTRKTESRLNQLYFRHPFNHLQTSVPKTPGSPASLKPGKPFAPPLANAGKFS
jgi:hypothetical protein